ncbi:MAG: DUF7305 domain-containing protein [Planctomycetota bacterium]|jgi:hypothetical protein
MNVRKLLTSRKSGAALTIVLFAVIILLLMGGGLLSLGLQGRMRAIRTSSGIVARCAADSALTTTVYEMNQKLKVIPWDDTALPYALDSALLGCDATFSYEVQGNLNSGYVATCVGKSGYAHRRVTATLRLKGLFDSGVMVKETIKLYSGTLVDIYDPATDVPVQIATTSAEPGSISLAPGASVDGEVLVGVEGYFPTVSVPLLPDMGMPIDVQGTIMTIGPEDSGRYTAITLKTGAALVADGGGEVILHVTGDVFMGQSCEVVLKPGTSLTLYLDGDLLAGNSTGINNESQDSTAFTLFGTGEDQKFELKAKSEWYGAVYAPNADVTIKSNAEVVGSFVSSSFETTGGALILYDSALRDVDTSDVGVFFIVDRWQED